MDCPLCENAMITFELDDVEVDHCIDCGGIWLDSGELELLLNDEQKAHKLLESFEIDKNCKEKCRKCPICDKKMQKILVKKTQNKVLIDKCPKMHGLWFDKGELDDILEKAELDKENKIRKIMADIFSREFLGKEKT